MQSCWIVKTLDVVIGRTLGLLMRLVFFMVNFFNLEGFEETFHRCIVVTVSLSAHALFKITLDQTFSKHLAGELRAAVRMDNQPFGWLADATRWLD